MNTFDVLPTSKNIADFTGKVWHADALELLSALPDKSVDMILCDLPYGVTACAWDEIIPLEPMWKAIKRVVKKRAAIVLTATEPFASKLRMSNINQWRYDWVWNKNNSAGFALARLRPFQITENVLVFGVNSPDYFPIMEERGEPRSKGGYSVSDNYALEPSKSKSNTYYPKNILEFSNAAQNNKIHPTQKPVELFEYLIRTYTQAGEIVLDFCSGSATTAIACLNLDRQYICGDSHLPYVEMARQRIASHDPFQNTPLKNGMVQKSLFAESEAGR